MTMTETESTEEAVDAEPAPETGKTKQTLLSTVRSTPRYRLLATGCAAIVGIVLATQHWIGLVVGGALVALPAQTLPRGIVAGALFGLLAVAVFFTVLWTEGLAGAAVDTGVPFLAAVGIGVVGGLFGALARGIL